MKWGICTVIDRFDEAVAAGFDYAEISVNNLAPERDDAAFEPVAASILRSPLPVEVANCFLPGELRVTGRDVESDRLQGYMETALKRAGSLGISVVVFGSGGARRLPEGFPVNQGWRQLDEAGRMAAGIGERYGVTIVMEPLFSRGCNFFNRVDQGSAMVDRINHPRLKLLADIFHMHAENEPFHHMTAATSRLAHVHVDTPSIPATGSGSDYDYGGFFAALRKSGYDGRISMEDNSRLFSAHAPPLTGVYRAALEHLKSEYGSD